MPVKDRVEIAFDSNCGREIDVVGGSTGIWRLTYTVGDNGLAQGGGFRIYRSAHKFWLGMEMQTDDPGGEDFCRLTTTGKCKPRIEYLAPWYKQLRILHVVLDEGSLEPDESITLEVGSAAHPAVVPQFTQHNVQFVCSVDYDASNDYTLVPLPAVVNVVPGPPAKMTVVVPSVAAAGEELTLKLRFEDRESNVGALYVGPVELTTDDPDATGTGSVTFTGRDRGVLVGQAFLPATVADRNVCATCHAKVKFATPGIRHVFARTADGKIAARSNPVRVSATKPALRVFWGDVHNHTDVADGTGDIMDSYVFGAHAAFLDVCGVSEHINNDEENGFFTKPQDRSAMPSSALWRMLQDAARELYRPGEYVTFLCYEWTPSVGRKPGMGDHCVYFLDVDAPMVNALERDDLIRRAAAAGDTLIIPHVGGGWCDWKYDVFDANVIRLVEVASMHEHSEWFVQQGLGRGCKLGIVGMSDGHMGLPGYDCWARHGRTGAVRQRHFSVQSAITAFCAKELTREAVWDSMVKRHTYATTGDRILLRFEVNGVMMGEEIEASVPPTVTVEVAGTAHIDRIDVIRNDRRIHVHMGTNDAERFEFRDERAPAGDNFYYVRVTQSNNAFAWSSPVFVRQTAGVDPKEAGKDPAWNDDVWPPEGPSKEDYSERLETLLALRGAGSRFDVKQVGVFEENRGRFALFRGTDLLRKVPVHIHYYLGFDDERIYISTGWSDYGQSSNIMPGFPDPSGPMPRKKPEGP